MAIRSAEGGAGSYLLPLPDLRRRRREGRPPKGDGLPTATKKIFRRPGDARLSQHWPTREEFLKWGMAVCRGNGCRVLVNPECYGGTCKKCRVERRKGKKL